MVSTGARRRAVEHLVAERGYSQRRACALIGVARSSVRYVGRVSNDEAALVQAIQDLAVTKPQYGYRQITRLLRRKGFVVNFKRVYRLWRELGLALPRRKRIQRRYGQKGTGLQRAQYPNHVWTYDFLEGRTERGGKLRILAVLDEYTRECLMLLVARSISAQRVWDVLQWLFQIRAIPKHLRSDNGPEFIAKVIQHGLREKHCQTLYITPGSPWENPFIESFNGKLRSECLDRHLFANGAEAQFILEDWRLEYNLERPHSSLNGLTPSEFAQRVISLTPTGS
jgi:transposase InsO family protein